MRDIAVEINRNGTAHYDRWAGYVGEANESRLVIELPEELLRCSYHVIQFETARQEKLTSNRITEEVGKEGAYRAGSKLYCPLWQQLTQGRRLRAQVEAYEVQGDTVERLGKSPLIELEFLPSVLGNGTDTDTRAHGLLAELEQLLAQMQPGRFYTKAQVDALVEQEAARLDARKIDLAVIPLAETLPPEQRAEKTLYFQLKQEVV